MPNPLKLPGELVRKVETRLQARDVPEWVEFKAEVNSLLNQAGSELATTQKQRDALTQENEKLSRAREEALAKHSDLEKQLANVLKERDRLSDLVDKFEKDRPKIKLTSLGEILKSALGGMEKDLAEVVVGGPGYSVENFEVELKSGFAGTAKELSLVQPALNELTPESLSTVRLSLRRTPRIELVRDGTK